VIYYIGVVNLRTTTKQYCIRFLFIRRAAVVCHAVTQKKVGFLQFFITYDKISKIFLAHTRRTLPSSWVIS